MPGQRQENRNEGDGDLQSLTIEEADRRRDKVNSEPPSPNSPQASTKSPSLSGSSVPYPFDSQSSLENESGSRGMYRNVVETLAELTRCLARRKSLLDRIIEKLHLSKSYLPGHVKGEVDQIIHSRRSSPCLVLRHAYAFIAVNEYCSGYGKVAAIENLDPDFSMYVFQNRHLLFGSKSWVLRHALGVPTFETFFLCFKGPPSRRY